MEAATSEIIRAKRLELGLSQKELAKELVLVLTPYIMLSVIRLFLISPHIRRYVTLLV